MVASSSIGQTVTIFDRKFGGGQLSSSLTHQLATIYCTLVKTSDEDGDEMDPILEVNMYICSSNKGSETVDCSPSHLHFMLPWGMTRSLLINPKCVPPSWSVSNEEVDKISTC